ncbi:MAG: hypothetical protein ACD_9C00190G0002 [uncultured bacterium]|nr:MAG: hypothetical protein ACD_9C00190G0002 [uncultured bacterium]
MSKKKVITASIRSHSRKYDELYEAAKKILSEYAPCSFTEGICMAKSSCCEDCRHLSENKGCLVKSLSCKLWLCDPAKRKFPECAKRLSELVDIARKYRFLGFRETKCEVLERVAAGRRSHFEAVFW